MSDLDAVRDWLDQQVPELMRAHRVPGASWAVLRADEVVEGAAGVLNLATGVEATTDSVFQIGSATKLWTASLVLQLADEGLLDLDAPVREVLPEFAVGDREATERITPRQLLEHTAGFEGDIFTDTGVGDDALEKYVAELHDVPQLFPPGERFSYNNAGYCVLGRVVEVLRGTTYDAALHERLAAPLGLTHVATSALEAILHRAAVGHVEAEPGGSLQRAPVWAMPRSNAPAGAMLSMTARDLVAFARMHLDDGHAPDGTRVLAAGTPERMWAHAVDLPALGLMGTSWGLGFERFDTPTGLLVGHDGTTIGQHAFLRMVPGAGVAVALLTNGGDVVSFYREVVGHVLGMLTDVRLPDLPAPPQDPETVDASRYLGTYSASVFDLTVSQDDDGRIWLDLVPKGDYVELGGQAERTELVHYGDDMLIPVDADRGMYMPHAFVGDDGAGHALYLHLGRAVRRAGV
ncbi:beta-lactamase family protein [Phycicoccus sp. CSK15P-2]|uniref:serine hydrolase domain-containing protein n=1 Tax=Phycicoccus sp. CSK15P-2 TaxID=2807627 RepID=UPI00194E5A30|nr:serine hydrolase domain-containing protein [Phycicoccus sp. CSK15P-2]MBM6404536.1 beta-lactamase family protein [Phycicoccus sp. CSK15P-2]